jgi:hypothetical protein
MTELSTQDKTVVILLERFEKQRLPRALSLKAKVDSGDMLSDQDFTFLAEMLGDAHRAKPVIDQHPKLQDLYAQVVHLYKEITTKALANEKRS